ncbi:xanthine dehydrogenase/oxidase-like isoform X1 [Antedon mediterranea]|uniref:xanthine dehydrogenase/oxidase-like isoform X1 n=1 Tax=Antedon mediterranea TaxID=105859 RepID=UPI003AF4F529
MSLKENNVLIFFCNGQKITDDNVDPNLTLLSYLRLKLRLTGSKLGCGEGGCGACTVMISSYDRLTKKITHISANACLTPICQVHMMAVTTVEGIGSIKDGLHPVQERIAKAHGSQCGFCTPGIVMSMYTLLRNNHQPTMTDIEDTFQGNLCRCTGYRPILEGYRTFTKDYQNDALDEYKSQANCCQIRDDVNNGNHVRSSKDEGLNGRQCYQVNCCQMQDDLKNREEHCVNSQSNGNKCCMISNGKRQISTKLFQPSEFMEYDPTQEKIFPPELILMLEKEEPKLVKFERNGLTWIRPVNLLQLSAVRNNFPNSKLVSGNTEIGVDVKLKKMQYPVLVSVSHVTELNNIYLCETGVSIGASVTLSRIEDFLKENMDKLPDFQCKSFAAIVDMLHWFAGQQIRNVAGIGGNIITGSPISDLNPILMAAGCTLDFADTKGVHRSLPIAEQFYTGYRKNAMKANETLISINIPYTKKTEHFKAFKQAHRRDDDIAIVNAAFRVDLHDEVVHDSSMAFGGMAPTTKMAKQTMNKIIGRHWDKSLLDDVIVSLANEMTLAPGAPGGMTEYRQSLVLSFFFKFYLSINQETCNKNIPKVSPSDTSATFPFKRDEVKSTQMFQEIANDQSPIDPVGRPLVHLSAYQQATGEAVYVDDIVAFQNELYMAVVLSKKALAKIKYVDATSALSMRGVHAFIDHKDVPGSNLIGEIEQDEELFATDKVTCVGQYIGAIVADNQEIAQRAARMVRVEYQDLEPILSIKDAIAKESYFKPIYRLEKGNVTNGFESSDKMIEGEMRIGEQEHFYLETQSCIAVPKQEEDFMEVFSATQDLQLAQTTIANVLGVKYHKVNIRTKRLGGGFGGKETRSCNLSAALAVAARRVGRPLRCMLDRDEDMASTGTRHAFLGRYKVGFSNDGKIQSLKICLYSNSGNALDLSASVMECALFHLQNAYHLPNVDAYGYCCKTNIPSNTAFRGFGRPQAFLIMENLMSEISFSCGMTKNMIRELNFLQVGQSTYYNQKIDEVHLLKRCWDECLEKSDYEVRQSKVAEFNRLHRWKKRGLSIIPLLYGVGFTEVFMNKGAAFVIIYQDGSVLLSHGGVEMGQGLYTKMIQVASRTLKIPSDQIFTDETSTNKVPNTSPTAGSVSSDLNGMAVKIACEKLYKRLEPYRKQKPDKTWSDWVAASYMDRVSLFATGFYKTPLTGFDWNTKTGEPFHYFTSGAAVSEVEIDCLTGDHVVLRTDIVMDVGDSINPAIDIGQIEGGFIQGYGLFTLEEHRWSPSGQLLTKGPGFYKIPSFTDIPVEFNVSLLDGVPHTKVVCSSKAIGEPPLFLAGSVFFAIKEAILASRKDCGIESSFRLDSPATAERIRMACSDTFTEKFPPSVPGTFTPFFIRS